MWETTDRMNYDILKMLRKAKQIKQISKFN